MWSQLHILPRSQSSCRVADGLNNWKFTNPGKGKKMRLFDQIFINVLPIILGPFGRGSARDPLTENLLQGRVLAVLGAADDHSTS